jgi:hypothetical protein
MLYLYYKTAKIVKIHEKSFMINDKKSWKVGDFYEKDN